MIRSIKLAVSAALALSATSALATNGSNLIGLGAKARAMGGATIGVAHGAESGLANAALITKVEDTEISFGGTIFMPNVENSMGQPGYMSPSEKSDADMSVIPEVSIASKVTDNFYWGIGMWGTAGMGVDYREDAMNFNMVTNLQLMQFGVPLAYTVSGFSIGFTPILQYGSLDMDYSGTLDTSSAFAGGMAPAESVDVGHGAGVSQDLKMGYNIGLAYEIADLTIGAVYKSQIDMEYKGQLSGAAKPFTDFGMFGGQPLGDKLSTPAEIGIGASYVFSGNTVALDYKQIKWSSAKGYEDFEWEDQSVIALGYEYAATGWAARLGYNYATSPIKEQDAATAMGDATGSAINMFNLLGFPAIVESHFTLGGSYNFSKQTSIDLAYAYAPEVKEAFTTAGFAGFGPMNPTVIETTHSQTSLSFQLNYNF
ncbi:MAG: outer membrane protein transport protein [Campylobacterota bacterium]|nr:outer membrane protein transport protein [Campylobacterota bacterium]